MDAHQQHLQGKGFRSSGGTWIDWETPPPLDDALLSLGRLARFAGHTSRYWTVLQHSYTCLLIAQHWQRKGPELARVAPDLPVQCLLHDWAEVLTNDVPSAFKPAEWRQPEREFVVRAGAVYGLHLDWTPGVWEAVHAVDNAALHAEGAALYCGLWDPGRAELEAVQAVLAIPHHPDGGMLHAIVRDVLREEGARGP